MFFFNTYIQTSNQSYLYFQMITIVSAFNVPGLK